MADHDDVARDRIEGRAVRFVATGARAYDAAEMQKILGLLPK